MTLAEKIAETAARFVEAQGDWHEEGREFVRLRELVREWRETHLTGVGGTDAGWCPTCRTTHCGFASPKEQQ